MQAIKILLGPNTVIIIENHYLGAVLPEVNLIPFTMSIREPTHLHFSFVAKALGLEILDAEFPARYGGNIRIFLGKAGRHQLDHEKTGRLALDEANYVSSFKKLEKNLKAWQFKKTKELSEAVAIHGKIKAKRSLRAPRYY